MRDEINHTLKKCGFELWKWTATHNDLLFTPTNQSEALSLSDDKQNIKTLGLFWDPSADNYTYSVQVPGSSSPITKGRVLASIASLFDPLGLVGPIIVLAKIIMQNLWLEQMGWDDVLPIHIQREWDKYTRNLIEIKTLVIPRWLGCGAGLQTHRLRRLTCVSICVQ